MHKRLVMAVSAVAAMALMSAPAASAAVEFGDTCASEAYAPGDYTLTTLEAPPATLPLTAPSSGVITKVKLNIDAESFPIPTSVPVTIKALRNVAETNFRVVGQSLISAGPGLTVADARIPVQAGDRLGLHGEPFSFGGSPVPGFSFYCAGPGIEGVLGAVPGDVPPGSTAEFAPVTEGRVPLAAILEPDADNDGYGDETQDQCPQSGAYQQPCPTVTLDSIGLAGRRSVTVYVATSLAAPVSVTGTVPLGKGKKATLSAAAQTVPPGSLVRFTLKFNKALKAKLKALTPKKKLTLKITASAANVVGQISTDETKLKLKGQAKP